MPLEEVYTCTCMALIECYFHMYNHPSWTSTIIVDTLRVVSGIYIRVYSNKHECNIDSCTVVSIALTDTVKITARHVHVEVHQQPRAYMRKWVEKERSKSHMTFS